VRQILPTSGQGARTGRGLRHRWRRGPGGGRIVATALQCKLLSPSPHPPSV